MKSSSKTFLWIICIIAILAVLASFYAIINLSPTPAPTGNLIYSNDKPDQNLDAKIKIQLVKMPVEIKPAKEISFIFGIDAAQQIKVSSVVLEYGSESDNYAFSSQNICSVYCPAPGLFSIKSVFNSPGKYFYRIRATVDGKTYFSEERSFDVDSRISNEVHEENYFVQTTKEGLISNGAPVSELVLTKNDDINIHLSAFDLSNDVDSIYFKGCGKTSERLVQGQETVINFVAYADCSITLFENPNNTRKESLRIRVR